MTSAIARHTLRQFKTTRPRYARCFSWNLYATSILPAQKKRTQTVIEDLFPSTDVNNAIEPESATETTAGPTVPHTHSALAPPTANASSSSTVDLAKTSEVRLRKKKKLSPESRLLIFDQLYAFVAPRLGRKPAAKVPLVRKSAWVNLIGLATTEEQLDKVAGIFPGWKDLGHEFDPRIAELFVRRCEELSCPLLALKVFGDFSKYNLRLSLPAARHLLHSLHIEYPIDTTITAAALYNVYNLPPIAQDLTSCSILASACFKHNTKDSLRVANALVSHLQTLLQHIKPIKVNENSTEKVLDKPRVWMKWSLKKVDKALLVQNGSRADWLRVWRTRSGHVVDPNRL